MKHLLGILCISVSTFVFCQDENRTEEIEDYNKDGFADTLRTLRDSGSGYGGRDCSIVNGATGEVYKIGIWASFGNIRHTMAVPPNLALEKNVDFLNRIKEELLATEREFADPSLQWIINANLSHYEIDDSSGFNLVLTPSNKWISGTPIIPDYYCIELSQTVFNKMYHTDDEKPEWYDEQKTAGYLTYSGSNHANFAMRSFDRSKIDSNGFYQAQSNDTYSVLKTAHGIAVQKGDAYKWLFITDASLTSAPDKLRWFSIGKITLHDHYIIFQHHIPVGHYSQFFIIDIETGVCARLQEYGLDFSVENDELRIKIDDDEMHIRDDPDEATHDKYLVFDLKNLLDQMSSMKAKEY